MGNESEYFNKVYDKFWSVQSRRYGYAPYEQNLVRLIAKSNPGKVFEVGIGTGWPIGTALKEKGIVVDGCDLAESSVMSARKELGNEEGIWVGDVMSYRGSEQWDTIYCVRASWYIPDFYDTLLKMISMTKSRGYLVFDVMDENSPCCLKIRWSALKEKYYRFLGIHVNEVYGRHFINISKMKKFLKKNGLDYQCWSERKITGNKDRCSTPKVVFLCRKEN